MASPKSTAIRMIGRKLMTGPVEAAPTRVWAQPHWKTATTAPSEAPIDRRKPIAALIGTTIDRNLINRRTSEGPTTRAADGRCDEQRQRAVEAGTELGRDELVGLALGGVGRGAGVVSERQAQAQCRDRQNKQGGNADGDGAERVPGDEAGPAFAHHGGGAGAFAA